MHLLVVEDERARCETIVRSLRRLAYSVDFCYDGDKALELLGVERYDLVLLDLNLPGRDGMTVLRTLRQTDRETRVLIPQEARLRTRWRAWTPGRMTIWRSPFIWRSWKRAYEASPCGSSPSRMCCSPAEA